MSQRKGQKQTETKGKGKTRSGGSEGTHRSQAKQQSQQSGASGPLGAGKTSYPPQSGSGSKRSQQG